MIQDDAELDEEYRAALRRLSTYVMEDARNVGFMVEVTLTLRALERIGGHAKNIGGYVIFLVTGRDVRHENLAKNQGRDRGRRVSCDLTEQPAQARITEPDHPRTQSSASA